jgi:hypothetical protein
VLEIGDAGAIHDDALDGKIHSLVLSKDGIRA